MHLSEDDYSILFTEGKGGGELNLYLEVGLKGVTFVTMHVPVESVRYKRCITKLFLCLVPTN